MSSLKTFLDPDGLDTLEDDSSPLANSYLNNKICLECNFVEKCLFKSNKNYCLKNFDKTDFPLELLFSPGDLQKELSIAQECENLDIFTIEGLRIDDIIKQYKKTRKISIDVLHKNGEKHPISLLEKEQKIPEEALKILNDFMGTAK
jgi:hypothetical protein